MIDLITHFVIGMMGAGAGWYARGFCKHLRHRIALTMAIVAAESWVTVNLVG